MNIAIVDDQKEYRHIIVERLYKMIEFDINTYSFDNTTSLMNSSIEFNLIILDIELANENGIDFAKSHTDKNIVFVTSYNCYMKNAYGKNVYAFIEKSDSEETFFHIMRKVIEQILEEKTIRIKTHQGILDIFIKDIIYIQYIRRKTICIKLSHQSYTVAGYGIQEFSNQLGNMFVFCDRDKLINKHRIIGIDKDKVILKGLEYTLKISSRRLKEIKSIYLLEKKDAISIFFVFCMFYV